MAKPTANFTCPNCSVLYQIIKAKAGLETTECDIACRICGGPFPARDQQFVLKYFLLRKAIQNQKWQRQSVPTTPV
jgi:hypothetical protein